MPRFIRGAAMRGITGVDNAFLMDYMPNAPEGYVKAYLFGLMLTALPDGPEIGQALSMGEEELAHAFAYWQNAGLVRVVASDPLTVEYLKLEHSPSQAPRRYAHLVASLGEAAGARVFTGHELAAVTDWIEAFGFDEETAVLCVTDSLARHGAKAKLWQMNAEAKLWADNGVATLADAQQYIARRNERNAGAQKLLARWKRTRRATEDELALYAKWTEDWGFDESVILSACQDMTGAAQPSFKYLDTVLSTYRMNGAVSEEALFALRRAQDAVTELARMLLQRAGVNRAPTAAQRDEVDAWRTRYRMDAELLMLAADAARETAQPWASLRRLVNGWHENNIATLAAAREDLDRRKDAAPAREAAKKGRALAHSQRKYSEEDLKKIGIDLLDD